MAEEEEIGVFSVRGQDLKRFVYNVTKRKSEIGRASSCDPPFLASAALALAKSAS